MAGISMAENDTVFPCLWALLEDENIDAILLQAALGTDAETVRIRSNNLSEANPMLGHRGCRLAITYPELPEMQARAIFEAAAAVLAREPLPERIRYHIYPNGEDKGLITNDTRPAHWDPNARAGGLLSADRSQGALRYRSADHRGGWIPLQGGHGTGLGRGDGGLYLNMPPFDP